MTDEVKVASDQTTAALMEIATKKRLVVIAEMRRFVKHENSKQYPKKLLSELAVSAPMGGVGWLPEGFGDRGNVQTVDETRPKTEQKRFRSRIEAMCDDILSGRTRDEGAGDDSSVFDHHQFSSLHDHQQYAVQDGESFAGAHDTAKAKGESGGRSGSPGGQEKKAWGRAPSPGSRSNRKDTKGAGFKAPGAKAVDATEPINKFMRGMSVEERELVAKVFRFIDVNGDGGLEFQEIKDTFKTVGVQVTSRDLDAMIQEVDADGDGTIDLKEFITMVGMAKLGLVGGGIGQIVFEKLRSLLDLARVQEDRLKGVSSLTSPDQVKIRSRKATESKSFKEKQKIAVHNDTMLLDWRTDDEKRRVARDQREKMRRGARDTMKGKAAAHALTERKKKLQALSRGPKVTLVPVSRPSLLEGTDVPSPRYVPKANSSNSGARASTPPMAHGGLSPMGLPHARLGGAGGVDGDGEDSPVVGVAQTARPLSAANSGGLGGNGRPGTSAY